MDIEIRDASLRVPRLRIIRICTPCPVADYLSPPSPSIDLNLGLSPSPSLPCLLVEIPSLSLEILFPVPVPGVPCLLWHSIPCSPSDSIQNLDSGSTLCFGLFGHWNTLCWPAVVQHSAGPLVLAPVLGLESVVVVV